MDEQRKQQIDASRRGDDSESSPELRELYEAMADDPSLAELVERSHDFDARVRKQVFNVPTPAGLEDRLLAAVSTPSSTGSESPAVEKNETKKSKRNVSARDNAKSTDPVTTNHVTPDRKRRNFVQNSALAVSALLLISATLFFIFGSDEPLLVPRDVANDVVRWHMNGPEWQSAQSLPDQYRKTKIVADGVRGRGWQQYVDQQNRQITVVRLALNGREGLLAMIPASPDPTSTIGAQFPAVANNLTGGFRYGVARQNEFVYILLVRGEQGDYRQFLRRASDFAFLQSGSTRHGV